MIGFRLPALALIAALSCAGAAWAQQPPPPASADQPGWNPEAMRQHMEARHAERLKALHDALNIRPDQEGAFAAFAAALRPDDHGDMRQHDDDDRAALAGMTTPERLDRMMQRMDERTARMRQRMQRFADATKALYAVLSPDQRRTLDALALLSGDHDGGFMGHRMDRGMDHGMGHDMGPPPPPMG